MNIEFTQQNNPALVIQNIRQQIHAMGANDAEFSLLDNIMDRWKNHELSDIEAINEAQGVMDAKQDYH